VDLWIPRGAQLVALHRLRLRLAMPSLESHYEIPLEMSLVVPVLFIPIV